jgi:hypothetical protein
LNGTNAFIEVPDSSLLYPGTNSFSLSAWVETTNAVGTREIFTRYENGGLNSGGSANSDYELYLTSGKLSGFLRDTDKGGTNSGGQELVGTRNVADGVFHYVALVRDVQNTQMVLYVDGAVEASAAIDSHVLGTITDDDGHPDSLLLGAAPVGQVSGQYVNFFQGVIDEAQYWNRALSTAEVQAMYAAGSAGLCRPAVPARLATPAWLGDGSLRLAFTNNGGAIFSVLASTNAALRLSNWTVLGVAAEVSAGHYQFTDPQATNNPRRFYRVRSP